MADLYNRNQQTVGGVFTTDNAVVTVSGGSGSWVNALVQQFSSQYSQNFSEIFELGSNNLYRVVGRPQGRMQIGSIIGLSGNVTVEDALYDACNTGGAMTVQATASVCGGSNAGGITMVYGGLFVVDYGVQMDAQSMMIRQNISLAFTYFDRFYT